MVISGNACVSVCVLFLVTKQGFPGDSDGKESACSAGDLGSIPGLGISPGEGNGNPLQNSCLENSMNRGPWQATVCVVPKSQTRLRDFHTVTKQRRTINTDIYTEAIEKEARIWDSFLFTIVVQGFIVSYN